MASKKKYLSANEFLSDSWLLAKQVRSSNWKPDIMIALWRGGAFPGVAMHEYLKTSGWSVDHYPLKCASYSGLDQNSGTVKFTFGEELFSIIKKGDKVLIVDDVFDSGKTANAVKERIEECGAEMKMACVYWKSSRNETNLKPDFVVKEMNDDWLVFPHELEGLTKEELHEKDPSLSELNNFLK